MQLFPAGPQIRGRGSVAAVGVVAVGGAIGASARWAVGTTYDLAPGGWPWPTLFVNLLGCLAIGIVANRVERGSLRWHGVVTGLLGGFTTMSSFAVELNDLVDLDHTGTALAYGVVTLLGGAAAVAGGSRMLPPAPGAST